MHHIIIQFTTKIDVYEEGVSVKGLQEANLSFRVTLNTSWTGMTCDSLKLDVSYSSKPLAAFALQFIFWITIRNIVMIYVHNQTCVHICTCTFVHTHT